MQLRAMRMSICNASLEVMVHTVDVLMIIIRGCKCIVVMTINIYVTCLWRTTQEYLINFILQILIVHVLN